MIPPSERCSITATGFKISKSLLLTRRITIKSLLSDGDVESNPGPIKILQLNCRSLKKRGRTAQLAQLASKADADILLLSETWLRSLDKTPHISGYGVVNRTDREDGSALGGGVICYARKHIPVTDKGTKRSHKCEVAEMDVRINDDNRSIALTKFYVSPDAAPTCDWNTMFRSSSILCGDCNIRGRWDANKYDKRKAEQLENYLVRTGREVLNDGSATLFHSTGTSAVDITACTANEFSECTWSTLQPCFSDHAPILTTINSISSSLKRHGRATWGWKTANWEKFHCISERRFTTQLSRTLTLDQSLKQFTNTLHLATRRSVPKGNLRGKIWWSGEAETAIQERTSAFEAYEKDMTTEAYAVYTHLRDMADQTVALSQRKCWRENAKDLRSDKQGWSLIAALDGRRRSGATNVKNCQKSNRDLADVIVKDYINKNRNRDKQRDTKWRKEYFTKANDKDTDMFISQEEFSMKELVAVIKSLPHQTAPGPDRIEAPAIQHLGTKGTKRLLQIVNSSWKEGATPAAWRETTIIGIPKPHDPLKLRPISLSSIICRIMERLVGLRLTTWAEDCLPDHQAGFRKHRNTTEHVGALAQQVSDSFSSKQKCAALFTDFSAAYDRVVVPALLAQLARLKCPPPLFAWIHSYLHDRRARGKFLQTTGRSHVLGCGLPQGSSISPTLWNVYIHTLNLTNTDTTTYCFADDTSIFASGKTWGEVTRKLNVDLAQVG